MPSQLLAKLDFNLQCLSPNVLLLITMPQKLLVCKYHSLSRYYISGNETYIAFLFQEFFFHLKLSAIFESQCKKVKRLGFYMETEQYSNPDFISQNFYHL
jgi:hypothetical protein